MENKQVCKNRAHLLMNGRARALMREAWVSGRGMKEGEEGEGLVEAEQVSK